MTPRCIVLIGFMGSGKTAVAKELARRLGSPFIDLDAFITQTCRRSPAQILDEEDEPKFREVETRALEEVFQSKPQIIALGGGTWIVEKNRNLIARHKGLSVWLDVTFDLCWKRITAGNEIRPLAPDRETALARYDSRIPEYSLAEVRIEITREETPGAIADRILELLEKRFSTCQ